MRRIGAKISAGFLLIVILAGALSFYTALISERSLRDSEGSSSEFLAEEILRGIDQTLIYRIDQLQAYVLSDEVARLTALANRRASGTDDYEGYLAEVEAQWARPGEAEPPPSMQELLAGDLSVNLRETFIDFYTKKYGSRVFARVLVANRFGGVIALSGRSGNFDQNGQAWWASVQKREVYVGQAENDPVSGLNAIVVGIPILDGDGRPVGGLKALVSLDEIVQQALTIRKKFDTTQIRVLRTDGRLVYSTRAFRFLEDVSQSQVFANIRGDSGYFVAREGGRDLLFSYSRDVGNRGFAGQPWILILGHDVAEVMHNATLLRNNIILASGLFVLASIAAALVISGSIARPILALRRAASEIARGNLEPVLEVRSRDELGALAASFRDMNLALRRMAEMAQRIASGDLSTGLEPRSEKDALGTALSVMFGTLKRQISELSEAAHVLAASGGEILASSTQLSAGAAETAMAVAQTSATVEEVKQTARLASRKARDVAENARRARDVSTAGRTAVQESVELSKRTGEKLTAIGQRIVKLSEQSQTIGSIMFTVDDLADQSSVLAVNAGIEAANAGEHGSGFAVVAREIKSLAEQSKGAAKQVRTLLGAIQEDTRAAVLAMEEGSRAMTVGLSQSESAGEAIIRLTESVEAAAEAATQIAASSGQQLVGMDQVAVAVDNIREAAKQNAESSDQLKSEVQNLNALGQKLKAAVERYRV